MTPGERAGAASCTPAPATAPGAALEVRAQCDACDAPLGGRAQHGAVHCSACGRRYLVGDAAVRLEQCPICGCRRFFRQKAFPRAVGIGLVVVGALLVPLTYGVSLMALALVDLLIYRLVPLMAVCYLCRAEFRGVPVPARVLPFRHHMAEGYEKRRAERRSRR